MSSSISKFVSINTETHVLDSRVIRRDYGYDDLYKKAEKVIKESSATLVQIPNLLTSSALPVLRGKNPFITTGGRAPAVVTIFWRPSDIISVRVACALQALARESNGGFERIR